MLNRRAMSPPIPRPAVLWLISVLAAAGCARSGPEVSSYRSIPARYVEGSFIVEAEATSSDGDVQKLSDDVASELGCKAKSPEKINWGAQDSGIIAKSLANTYNLAFENCDFSQDGTRAILGKIAGDANVLSVQAEAIAAASPIPENDPDKSLQAHLPFIRRDAACALADKSGPPVVVAVVDTGVDLTHPDLQNILYRDVSGQIVGANFVGSRSQMAGDSSFADQNGHGTHVAGLIAAQASNGVGVVGVAGCANVKIMPVRVLGADGSGSSIEIDRGVKWAVDHGATIINLSLGYLTSVNARDSRAFYDPLYADAAAKNVMIFAAAGNDGETLGRNAGNGGQVYSFPASYDHVISVAATDNSGSLTSFSDRGSRVDIAAPGYNVLSTIRGGSYGRMSGTSMASPVAAGAYALATAVARLGLASPQDRIDVKTGEAMLLAASLDNARLSTGDVAAGGVIDAEKLAQAMAAKYPRTGTSQPDEPTEPTEPTETGPSNQPTTPTTPASFSFANLSNGATPALPQVLSLQGIPSGTYVVYFFWGTSPYPFTSDYVDSDETSLTDSDQWYFYGTRVLRAVAFSPSGRVLGIAQVQLKGQ